MARIVVSASGGWGHLLPMLALGTELAGRGHAVRVATHEDQHPLVRAAGFEPWACGPRAPEESARRWTEAHGTPVSNRAEANQALACLADTPGQFRDLAHACEGADLLVAHAFQFAAALVHEHLRIPWVCVSTSPGQFKHCEYPACTQPAPLADLNVLASSLLFSAPDLEHANYVCMTGFLYFDGGRIPAWQPSPQVRTFVEDGARALVLTMGSQPGPLASSVASTLARAAVLMGRKLVIQPNGHDLDAQALQGALDAGLLCLAGALDHDWLLARAEAVIHFGGTGICARTLRSGVPSLVLPQRPDQFFNARCMLELGAGAAMAPASLNEENAQRILDEKVLTPAVRSRTEAIAHEISQEEGAKVATRWIERLL